MEETTGNAEEETTQKNQRRKPNLHRSKRKEKPASPSTVGRPEHTELLSSMKYLDEPRLAYWSNFLESVELGDRLLSLRADAFSCERSSVPPRRARIVTLRCEHIRPVLAFLLLAWSYLHSFSHAKMERAIIFQLCVELVREWHLSFFSSHACSVCITLLAVRQH